MVTVFISSKVSTLVSVSCTRIPPSILRTSNLFSRAVTSPTSKTRKFFFFDRIDRALSSNEGAKTISTNTLLIASATAIVQTLFKAIIPPKAERLSELKARV